MAAMTPNSDWWSRAKLPPRPQPIEIRKRELLATLRKGEHAVTLEKRPVYGVADCDLPGDFRTSLKPERMAPSAQRGSHEEDAIHRRADGHDPSGGR